MAVRKDHLNRLCIIVTSSLIRMYWSVGPTMLPSLVENGILLFLESCWTSWFMHMCVFACVCRGGSNVDILVYGYTVSPLLCDDDDLPYNLKRLRRDEKTRTCHKFRQMPLEKTSVWLLRPALLRPDECRYSTSRKLVQSVLCKNPWRWSV